MGFSSDNKLIVREAHNETSQELLQKVFMQILNGLGSKNSVSKYRIVWSRWEEWVRTLDPPKSILDISPLDVENWLAYGMEDLSSRTKAQYLTVVKTFYSKFTVNGLVPFNPARESKVRKTGKKNTPWLNEYELKGALNLPKNSWQDWRAHLAILLGSLSGLRRHSMRQICVEHYSPSERLLEVYGKGGKVEKLALPAITCSTLNAWIKYANLRSKDHIFVANPIPEKRQYPAKSINPKNLYLIIKSRLIQAGISDEKATPHALRRTYATLLSSSGLSVNTIKDWMMHSSVEQTEQYIKLSKTSKNAPGDILADALIDDSEYDETDDEDDNNNE